MYQYRKNSSTFKVYVRLLEHRQTDGHTNGNRQANQSHTQTLFDCVGSIKKENGQL